MIFTLECYHEINGTRSDLGGFPYSEGIIQRAIKDFEYGGVDKSQDIEEDNQKGDQYIIYANDKNFHSLEFQIQVTEIDFFLSLKYHSHVYLTIEGDKRRFLKYKDVEIEQVSNTVYIANLLASDDKSTFTYKGDVL